MGCVWESKISVVLLYFLLFILLILLVLWEEDCVSSSWMCVDCVDWERRFRHGDEGSVVMWEVRETLRGKREIISY